MKNQIEAIVLIALGLGTGWAWHQWYVKPHDEARYQIMDCMDGDNSRAAYDACVAQLRPNE